MNYYIPFTIRQAIVTISACHIGEMWYLRMNYKITELRMYQLCARDTKLERAALAAVQSI
jgi:hypothetical protein